MNAHGVLRWNGSALLVSFMTAVWWDIAKMNQSGVYQGVYLDRITNTHHFIDHLVSSMLYIKTWVEICFSLDLGI